MADNLKTLQSTVSSQINNSGGPNSITATVHESILIQALTMLGKYTGTPFMSRNTPAGGVVPAGTLFWNSNAMNNAGNIQITFSGLSSDLNPTFQQVRRCCKGSIIHFKDYSGRSALFTYVSHNETTDAIGNDIVDLIITPFATNPNYVYSATDDEICIVEFFSIDPCLVPYGNITFKQAQVNTNADEFQPQAGDYAEGVLSNGKVMDFGIYLGGGADILDEASYDADTIVIAYDPND